MTQPSQKLAETTRKTVSANQRLASLQKSLTTLDWRLLHWLLRYPLQRADDLEVGVTLWASRATVYRHLDKLQEQRLLERVLAKTPGEGKQLYSLSNLGVHVLATHLQTPAETLAHEWKADEAGLLRLLPRLPSLIALQDVVNGLVIHAADALTTQGHRPHLVRWTWQRDLTHQFLYRERALHLFADAALALCIRTQLPDKPSIDQWYGLLFLSTALDDERLMRQRLERLLCWRESPERWSYYQHMLPVLILATSARQRDHWQRACDMLALKLRLDPPIGAIICLPLPEAAHANPWRSGWHTLSTKQSCHIQDLLQPLPRNAFPSSFRLDEDAEQLERSNEGSAQDAPSPPTVASSSPRLSRIIIGNLEQRMAHIAQWEQLGHLQQALVGLRLTSTEWNILYMLLAHPFLADTELAIFLHMQQSSIRSSLYELHRLNCCETIPTEVGRRWHLCEPAFRLLAAANHLHVRNIAELPDAAEEAQDTHLVRRGEGWFRKHMPHTAGIYGFFAMLAQAACQTAEHELCWWETGALCERRYQVNEQWYNLRPDALAAYRVGQRHVQFWFEWDRGTMNVRDLSIKFTSYAHYIASREWARDRSPLPLLVCVTPTIAQESRLVRVAQMKLEEITGFALWTTTADQLVRYGPLAPIWLQHFLPHREMPKAVSSSRQDLFAISYKSL
jgi:predicted transcriptional regulator